MRALSYLNPRIKVTLVALNVKRYCVAICKILRILHISSARKSL